MCPRSEQLWSPGLHRDYSNPFISLILLFSSMVDTVTRRKELAVQDYNHPFLPRKRSWELSPSLNLDGQYMIGTIGPSFNHIRVDKRCSVHTQQLWKGEAKASEDIS